MIPLWYHSHVNKGAVRVKLITRNTDYAIRAVTSIAKNGKGVVSVAELVKELRLPMPFLRKIMQALGKKGLIKSYKGPGGGFKLTAAPKNIYLSDIISVFQGPLRLNECIFRKSRCANTRICPLKKKIDAIERHVREEVDSITVASLI